MKRRMFYQIVKRKFYLFFMLLLVLINFSCKSDDDYVTNTDNGISVNSLSGEDIFKGIFFLEGDISKNIAHLKPLKEVYDKQLKKLDNYENQKKEISDIENKIINQMKSIEPDFFGKFREAITSNNPLVTETAIKRASSLFIDALYSDIELKPYLVNSEFLLKKLDNSKIMNGNNGIDPVKLENELNSIISQYSNSKNTLSNFGIESNNNQITMCAATVVVAVSVAAAVAAVTVVVASAYAVVLNVAAAVNAAAAVNVTVTINDGGGTGGGGGGGASCSSCHRDPSNNKLLNGKKKIKNLNEIGFNPMPLNCGGKVRSNNTETEIFLKDVTVLLSE